MIDTTRQCGAEYQEGAATDGAECDCGTFAIGRCAECRTPVCGTHSGLRDGARRLCTSCWRAADDAAAAAAGAQAQRAANDLEQRRRAWAQGVRRELADADPVERIVRVYAGLSASGRGGRPIVNQAAAEEVLAPDERQWSAVQISSWFLGRVRTSPPDVIRVSRKTLFGWRERDIPGWDFRGASLSATQWKDAPLSHSSIAVTPKDGMWLSGPMGGWHALDPTPEWAIGEPNFSGYGLALIALELNLRAVRRPPMP